MLPQLLAKAASVNPAFGPAPVDTAACAKAVLPGNCPFKVNVTVALFE